MEEMACLVEEEIIEMSVSNSEQVCDDAIARATLDIRVHNVFTNHIRVSLIVSKGSEIVLNWII